MEDVSSKVAENLLKINAVKLRPQEPFTWSSGWKSPIYCDNRLILSYPDIRNHIKEAFASYKQRFFPHATAIAGVATAGISHGALLADLLELPFIYVRAKAKGHGMQNLIEGQLNTSAKYLVIEDLISTGGSSIKAIDAIRDAGGTPVGLLAIFSYGFPIADSGFADAEIEFHTLCDLPALLQKALENDYISASDLSSIENWSKDPEKWSSVNIV